MLDVITVGSATVDVFVRTEFCDMVKEKGKDCVAYPVGSKILIDELIITTGGGGTNTAVSLASRKLNSRTGYSIILDSVKHDRTILNFRGSNNDLRYNEVKLSKIRAKW